MATLLAATAFASQAQVTVTGKVSEWVDNTKLGSHRVTSLATEPTSNINFSATEKLGNGLTARAVLETSLNGNTFGGTPETRLGDRQGTVGLASKFASVDLGRNVHSQFLAISNNDAFGTLYGSVAGDVHNLRGLRMNQGVYVALTPVKNVAVTFDRTQTGGFEAQAFSASASLLGANATVAQYKAGSEQSTVIGASYKLGAAQLSYTHSDNKGVAKSKGDLVGVRYTLANNLTAKASYGKTNTQVKAYNLGLDYALSKRTEVGVSYRNVDRVATVNDVKQLGVGVTHRF